jgi:preprotein translocase SecE subunit
MVPAAQFREAFKSAAADASLGAGAEDRPKLDADKLKDEIGKADMAVLAYFDDENTGELQAAGLKQLAVLRNVRYKQEGVPDDVLERRGLKKLRLPAGAFQMDQLTLRDLNDRLTREYRKVKNDKVKIGKEGDRDVTLSLQGFDRKIVGGAVVSLDEYEKAVAELKKDHPNATPDPHNVEAPDIASGPTTNKVVPLLPALAYTVPVLVLAVAIWLSWRAVNLPAFADFLIATEAELNKVSWTTRPRLIQDTIVVLVTVILMAGYLFLMDQTWRTVLSLPFIKVLQFPDETSDKNKSAEEKPW